MVHYLLKYAIGDKLARGGGWTLCNSRILNDGTKI
jgi:hypothetical protein